jgi:hypothetical protein
MLERGTRPLPFFWKCVKRKGFKSFVLKVCESKGVADVFFGKCVKRKSLGGFWPRLPFGLPDPSLSFQRRALWRPFSAAST